MLAGDELPVVEAGAVLQEQIEIGGDERTAVLIDGLLGFERDFIETIHDDGFLAFAQVQSLVQSVGKESVLVNLRRERGPDQQVGMEYDSTSARLIFAFVGGGQRLPRPDENEGALLIIVLLLAVDQIAAGHLFEIHYIQIVRHAVRPARIGAVEIENADQRMVGGVLVEGVESVDGIEADVGHD